MDIHGPSPPGTPHGPAKTAGTALHVGQRLRATVVRLTANHGAVLQLNNQQVRAQTPLPLTPGQRLEVEVSRLTPSPVLKLRAGFAPQHAGTVHQALQTLLPRQNSFAPLAANLAAVLGESLSVKLPKPVLAAAHALLDGLPKQNDLTRPVTLRDAITRSGLFLEHRLATTLSASSELNADLKTLLLRLIVALARHRGQAAAQSPTLTTPLPTPPAPPLRPLPPQTHSRPSATAAHMSNVLALLGELERQSESALARLQLHQLRSLPDPEDNAPQWALELPARNHDNVDIFQLMIGREQAGKSDSQTPREWTITIAVDLAGLGPMYITLRLLNRQVTAAIWAERKETVTLARRYKEELVRRFRQAGLEPLTLECHEGTPPPPTTSENHAMLDLRV